MVAIFNSSMDQGFLIFCIFFLIEVFFFCMFVSLLGYEGLQVINPDGGTEDAEVEAQKGRWRQEVLSWISIHFFFFVFASYDFSPVDLLEISMFSYVVNLVAFWLVNGKDIRARIAFSLSLSSLCVALLFMVCICYMFPLSNVGSR